MPVFDYRCTECETTYDVYHRGKEMADDIFCPKCGSKQAKKLMSAPMVAVGSSHHSQSGGGSCDSGGGCCGGACGNN